MKTSTSPCFFAVFDGIESFVEMGAYRKICDQNVCRYSYGPIIREALQYDSVCCYLCIVFYCDGNFSLRRNCFMQEGGTYL